MGGCGRDAEKGSLVVQDGITSGWPHVGTPLHVIIPICQNLGPGAGPKMLGHGDPKGEEFTAMMVTEGMRSALPSSGVPHLSSLQTYRKEAMNTVPSPKPWKPGHMPGSHGWVLSLRCHRDFLRPAQILYSNIRHTLKEHVVFSSVSRTPS